MADKTIPDFVFPSGSEKPDMSRDDLAAVAEAVAALSPEDQSLLAAVQVSPYRLTTAEQFREFPDNIDFFVLEPQVKQMEDLGWRYLEQHLDLELSPALKLQKDLDAWVLPFVLYVRQVSGREEHLISHLVAGFLVPGSCFFDCRSIRAEVDFFYWSL